MALNATEPPSQELLLVHARERGANVAGVPSPTWRHDLHVACTPSCHACDPMQSARCAYIMHGAAI